MKIAPVTDILIIVSERVGEHDDAIKWKHFPRYCPFVRGIDRSPVNSPHKGQWRGTLLFSLICAWINGWVNNRQAGDLRRSRTHYDVTVNKNMFDLSGPDLASLAPPYFPQIFTIFISPECLIYASLNQVSLGSGNGFSPVRRQAITWTNADLLSIRPSGINFNENWIEIQSFSFMKMSSKISSAKSRPFCPGRDELTKPEMVQETMIERRE